MRAWRIDAFGLENLGMQDLPEPVPGPGEVCVDLRALSLNYRDLLVLRGQYNPRFKLPAIPLSDGAGVVSAVGPDVSLFREGDRVVTHFVSGWSDGPFREEYLDTTLGLPCTGVAAEQVVLPERALLHTPRSYDFDEAATLPIAALTAWSALVTEGGIDPEGKQESLSVLCLGTGGVSLFALSFAHAFGAEVLVTSSSHSKLERALELGADHGINYAEDAEWDRAVRNLTCGVGVDLTVETCGAGTLNRSMAATRAGGTLSLIGVLAGAQAPIQIVSAIMKRQRLQGILVDSRSSFRTMIEFIDRRGVRPVIDRVYPFSELPAAFERLASGRHFGKIVLTT